MTRGRNIQAAQKDLVVQELPDGLGDLLVQESQVAQDCQDDFPLKVLLKQPKMKSLSFTTTVSFETTMK